MQGVMEVVAPLRVDAQPAGTGRGGQPRIVLVGLGTTFDETNFGDSRGGMKNLLLQPMGDKALGTIPMHDCTFVGCEFYNVGFTGAAEILEQLAAVPTVAGPAA